MGPRVLLIQAWLLAGCLSSPERGSGSGSDCVPVAFSEDFDADGWETARWGESDEDEPGTLRAEGGRAVIDITGDAEEYGWFATTADFDFTDRCVYVDVPTMLEYGEELESEAFLGVILEDNWIAIGQSEGSLCCDHEIDGEHLEERCEGEYAPEAHARWRLRFDGGEVACDVAPADGAWTEYQRLPYVGPLTGSIELLAGAWETVPDPGEVAFDNLNR